MSLIKLPTEVLLCIFNIGNLEPVDLKNLRLAHSHFRYLAAERLFRRLCLHFEPKYLGNGRPTGTTVLQRIQKLVSGSIDDADETAFRAANYRELSILFRGVHNNGFLTFTRSTCKELFPLFDRLRLLKIKYDSTGTEGDTKGRDLVFEGQKRFFSELGGRFLSRGLAVERLEYHGVQNYLKNLSMVENLKSLKLNIQLMVGWHHVPPSIARDVGLIMVGSHKLEELWVSVLRDGVWRGSPPPVQWDFMDDVMRVLGQMTKLKTLTLATMPLPRDPDSLMKLKWLEDVKVKTVGSITLENDVWRAIRSSGVDLKRLRGRVCVSEELLEYLANRRSIQELGLASQSNYTGPKKPTVVPLPTALQQKWSDAVVPAISETLTRLSLYVDAKIRLRSGPPNIFFQLLPSFTSGKPKLGQGFSELMDFIRPLDKLTRLKLILTPLNEDNTIYRNTVTGKEVNRWLDVSKGWSYSEDGNEEVAMWKAGLALRVIFESWDSQLLTWDRSAKSTSTLVRDEERKWKWETWHVTDMAESRRESGIEES